MVREGKLSFRFYDLLLANRQIYKEAHHVARRQHLAQLQESQQIFCLYQKQVEVGLGSPTCSWVVGSGKAYHPKKLNAETLAALRLPMLGLRIYKTCGFVNEHVDSLREFCCKLRTALDKEGATRTWELHFSRQILDEDYHFKLLADMRGLLSPPSTYSVTIVHYKESRAFELRIFVNVIGSTACVRCGTPPPLPWAVPPSDNHEIP